MVRWPKGDGAFSAAGQNLKTFGELFTTAILFWAWRRGLEGGEAAAALHAENRNGRPGRCRPVTKTRGS